MEDVAGEPIVPSTDRYVVTRSLRLHYVDYGGDGEVVVALPGWVRTARAFDSIAPVLAPHVHLLALDFRGRGSSDWGPPGQYRIFNYLLDLQHFVNGLGLDKFALIGTSLGGLLAQLYATAHPKRVSRLVLNDWSFGASLEGILRVMKRYTRAPAEFANLDDAKAWFLARRDGLDRLDPETLTRWVSCDLTPTPAGGLRFNCDPALIQPNKEARLDTRLGRVVLGSMDSWVAWELVKRLNMPLLILRGGESEVISKASVERLLRILPTATCVEVAGVGHAPTLYEPEAREAVREFFGIPSARSAVAPIAS